MRGLALATAEPLAFQAPNQMTIRVTKKTTPRAKIKAIRASISRPGSTRHMPKNSGDHDRHVFDAEAVRREDAPMPGDDAAMLVAKHRDRPAPFLYRRRNLRDLLGAVRARVAGSGNKLSKGTPRDLVRRPWRQLNRPWNPGING
jgi:hypothetical protein